MIFSEIAEKRAATKTIGAVPMNNQTRHYFANGPLKYEYQLYAFTRQLFNERLRRAGITSINKPYGPWIFIPIVRYMGPYMVYGPLVWVQPFSSLLLVQIRLFYITASTALTIKQTLFNAVYASSQVTRQFQHCFRLFFVFTWPLWTLVDFKLFSQKVKDFRKNFWYQIIWVFVYQISKILHFLRIRSKIHPYRASMGPLWGPYWYPLCMIL